MPRPLIEPGPRNGWGTALLPEFARRFVCRTAELTGSNAGLLVVLQEGRWQVAALHTREASPAEQSFRTASLDKERPITPAESPLPKVQPDTVDDHGLNRMLGTALSDFVGRHSETVVSRPAEQILGPDASSVLGWSDCTMVRLPAANGELAGLLCLSRPSSLLSQEDRVFLETMAGHAAMALVNARLFTRDRTGESRHWVEIFDAISDFIVVHDEADKVLRVNRSLATMIGVPPAELIGVNMRALMALTSDTASYSCPFCRPMKDDSDEFAHPVFDRTYLVSTSRVHGDSDGGLQTIHVLKDITPTGAKPSAVTGNCSTIFRKDCSSARRMDASSKSTTPWCGCWAAWQVPWGRIAADRYSGGTLFFARAARSPFRSDGGKRPPA